MPSAPPPPKGAVLEAIIPHPSGLVALYDVADLLPTRGGRRQPPRPAGAVIERVYVHKSGGEGRGGFAGLLASARYVIRRKPKSFPGMPYHLWAGREVDRTPEGWPVLYRGAHDDRRTWHTGGICNEHGVSLALQGNLSTRDLTPDQRHVAEAALLYLRGCHALDPEAPISTHSRAKLYGAKKSKSVCPGRYAEEWLAGYLEAEGLPALAA